MSNFNIILIAVFIVFAVVAMLIFSGAIPTADRGGISGASGNVVIWGTVPRSAFVSIIDTLNTQNRNLTVRYVAQDEEKLDKNLLEALASGTGPDILLLPEDLIVRHENKIFPIPYETYPERTFRDTFIAAGELYLTPQGVLGLPLTIDPLVMYYNRTLISNAGIAKPPEFWDEMFDLASRLTIKDNKGNITQSVVAFGEFDNVTHAKDILSLLILQAGSPIVFRLPDGSLASGLISGAAAIRNPVGAALSFYTDFSNPTGSVYSWNRSLPLSRNAFIAGDLVFYVGFASELFKLREGNPNLDFDVTSIPQTRDTKAKVTLGTMKSLSVLRASRNPQAAFVVATQLSGKDFSFSIAQSLALPPVRRDLLSVNPGGLYLPIFYEAALRSQAWLDPSPEETAEIFRTMVSDINSGKSEIGRAVSDANKKLDLLLR